ncbi:CPBP family intramembrane glutamic endopeptidase [Nocardioides aequoreus]|uniref:CPBP family intramembrane glutamic endopeptidase n=1 Tax=Nocardioides aequoreus TaxID=397278 RepID=UPI00068F70C3|nr:CPBP family intramembrane glutamic endopeptidase [Nocardioides aequoreus]
MDLPQEPTTRDDGTGLAVATPGPMPPGPRTTVTPAPARAGDLPSVPQYSRRRILGTWAAATLPTAALAWVGAPLLADSFEGPSAWPRAILLCLTAGLVWQFILVMGAVRHEQGTLRWSVAKEALWLRPPRSPHSGRRGGRLWWLLVPLVLLVAATEELPSVPSPDHRDLGTFLQSNAGQDFLAGNWPWFALILTMMIFNTVLGEELLFRGLLLPRMRGAFGRADWAANGVLFAVYHLHTPWVIPASLLDTLLVSYPASRYRSSLIGICVHSVQTVVLGALTLLVVLG